MGGCRVEIADSEGLMIRNEQPSQRNTTMLNVPEWSLNSIIPIASGMP